MVLPSLVMISYSVDWISRNTGFSILRMLARGMESMVCPAMKCSSDLFRCVCSWMSWNAMSAPGKNGAPTGFALGYLGKKGVNSDFISIHEEPPVILYIALLSLVPSLSVLL